MQAYKECCPQALANRSVLDNLHAFEQTCDTVSSGTTRDGKLLVTPELYTDLGRLLSFIEASQQFLSPSCNARQDCVISAYVLILRTRAQPMYEHALPQAVARRSEEQT
jgi:hypothetical protein